MPDIQNHRTAFLGHDNRAIWRIALHASSVTGCFISLGQEADLIICIVQHRGLALIKVLDVLLPLHGLEHRGHLLTRCLAFQQKSAASFEQRAQIVNVRAGEVIEADLHYVQD